MIHILPKEAICFIQFVSNNVNEYQADMKAKRLNASVKFVVCGSDRVNTLI